MNGCLNNCSVPSEFHLLAFSSYAEGRHVLFFAVLMTYQLAVLGNLVIIILVCSVSQLHTPMYFFLCILSIQDIIYVSITLPKLMAITATGNTTISFSCCITQMYLFTFCVITEFFLLTAMAYDRYVAICIPLHYVVIMKKKICATLVCASWFIGTMNSLTYAILVDELSFYSCQGINHFYCDLKTMILFSCSDTTNIKVLLAVETIFLGFLTFALILTSYVCIISTILEIRSTAGRAKALSSCSSHLTVVLIFYGTSLSLYVKPEHLQEQDKMFSLLYTAVVPLLNPLVYSLRNKEVLRAFKHMSKRYFSNIISTHRVKDAFFKFKH